MVYRTNSEYTSIEDISNEFISLDNSKACPKNTIPQNIIKQNIDIFAQKLHMDFNFCMKSATFPNNMKLGDDTPAHKQGDRTDKANYRPVSILPSISKIYERLMYYQINNYMENKSSKYLCGFRKGLSAQHCLIVMLEKLRTSHDKKIILEYY